MYIFLYVYENNNLSNVVLTQNSLWKNIPTAKATANVIQKFHNVNREIIYAAIMVKNTSIIAIFIKRYLCAPFPGSPKMSLYLHK